MTLYVIADWQDKFETAETRKLDNLKWSPAPNKLDGLGYRLMAAQRDRCELFAAWNLLRAIASKTTPKESRGRLERDGRPLTPAHLALMSGFPEPVFVRAFDFFSSPDMRWLFALAEDRADSATAADPERSGASPMRPAVAPASPAETSAVWKGRVEKSREGKCTDAPTQPFGWSEPAGWQGVTEELRKEWADAYPACTLDIQLAQMAVWLKANPARARKSNWLKFVSNWLKKEQDRGGDLRGKNTGGGALPARARSVFEIDKRIEACTDRINVIFRAAKERDPNAAKAPYTPAEEAEVRTLKQRREDLKREKTL